MEVITKFINSIYFKRLQELYDIMFVILGGSRSIGTELDNSDYDLFIYYKSSYIRHVCNSEILEYKFIADNNIEIHYTLIHINDLFRTSAPYSNNGILYQSINMNIIFINNRYSNIVRDIIKITQTNIVKNIFLKRSLKYINPNVVNSLNNWDNVSIPSAKTFFIFAFPFLCASITDINILRNVCKKIKRYNRKDGVDLFFEKEVTNYIQSGYKKIIEIDIDECIEFEKLNLKLEEVLYD